MEIPDTLAAIAGYLERSRTEWDNGENTGAGLVQSGIDRIEIHHDIDNPASGRVAARAGFHEVGPIEADRKAPADSGTHLVWASLRPQLT